MSAPLTRRRWALDLSAVALLLAVPILGFWPTFGGPAHLVAAVGGLALGMGIAAVGAWLRWGALVVAAVTVAVYFVFGAALALPQTALLGVVPGVESLRQLALGVVTSWKQLLTTVAPVSAADGFLVVPFLMLLVAGVLTTS
ncbi:MAG: transglutaminase domain-containing protein, partial [Microbacterium sp.]|nr:transglutaminase domain-containing protein [Microbacterium sp.]